LFCFSEKNKFYWKYIIEKPKKFSISFSLYRLVENDYVIKIDKRNFEGMYNNPNALKD